MKWKNELTWEEVQEMARRFARLTPEERETYVRGLSDAQIQYVIDRCEERNPALRQRKG